MAERYYLGFDAGTQSVKVAVYDGDGACVAQVSHPTTIRYPEPRCVEMDLDEYLRLTIQGIRECTEEMSSKGMDPLAIRSVMGDGIICGITGVDSDGNAVTPFINYLDSRTQEDADAAACSRRSSPDGSCATPPSSGSADASSCTTHPTS